MIEMGAHSYNPLNDLDVYWEIKTTIGKFCSIASGVKVYSGNHPVIEYPQAVSQYPFFENLKLDYFPCGSPHRVIIGNDVWIAEDVSILDGVTIGDGAIIAMHAVVTKDVPPYAFVAGNPAMIKHYRFPPEVVERLLKIKWWDWSDELIAERIRDFKDINVFIGKYGNR